MTTWTSDKLSKIEAADELQLAALRPDGTLRNAVTIWVIRVGNDLYVRSANGRAGAWFRAAQVRHEGHIQAGGVDKDVTFVVEVDNDVNDRIDVAYRAKYRRYGGRYVNPWWPLRREPRDHQARAALNRRHAARRKNRGK